MIALRMARWAHEIADAHRATEGYPDSLAAPQRSLQLGLNTRSLEVQAAVAEESFSREEKGASTRINTDAVASRVFSLLLRDARLGREREGRS
jgi:hypothetical protein